MFTRTILICSFVVAANFQNIQSSKGSSCDSLCSCEEKDGILHINCEEKDISKISQIKVPPSLPFQISLYKNEIAELHAHELESLSNAVSLHLGANNIHELEPGIFSAFGCLKKLHINSNFLVTLKEDTFRGLENLEYLQADTNFIHAIEPGAFSKLIRLKVLILNDNEIEFLPSNIFRFVPLTHLDLRGNKLQALPFVGFLEHIGRIIELLLEDNKWVCDCDILPLKNWIENMRTQSVIGEVVCDSPVHLQGNILSKVKREVLCPFHADIDLEEPSKSSGLIITPSPKVKPVPKETQIEALPTPVLVPDTCPKQCFCNNHQLAGLLIHCQDRGIQSLSDLGSPTQSPRQLLLTGNMIQRLIKSDFVAFGSLELLNLDNNHIEYIQDEAFLKLGNLQKLNLNGNKLERLTPGMFAGLRSLEYLYLEFNMIKDIVSGTFNNLPKLRHLSLKINLLQSLPPLIFHNVPLNRLDLRKNLFMHVPVGNVMDQLDFLEQIYLEDNPWDCSCDLVGLKQWVEKLRQNTVEGDILCHTPRKIAKKDLRSLRNELLCPGLVPFNALPTQAPTATTSSLFGSFTDSVPLSVLILGLLIVFLMIVFCAAGLVVLVLHRHRRSKKKQTDDPQREPSPIHLQYSMYGQKTTHHMTQRPGVNMYDEHAMSPVIQVCRSPSYCNNLKDQDLNDIHDSKYVCRSILEKENDSPLTGSNMKFRAVSDHSSEFVTLEDANSLYRNLLERERELQQLSITEYLRKNINQLQSNVDVHCPGSHEELKLMQTIMYTRPRKVMVEQTKKEYLELKANLHTEPDYLEVLEQQTALN
ncbi:SLIT and NTRK-like protein 6 [Acipenser oxyrinchus oxyrinchus]|uniref:SLIT and NTRK-like protein 6 n=1 Tax=Acipenser oxyrinchus oxyrinchus TaxID=40147 RepID=A0AAD8G970_ACIOX|nr:SLIT and NTRK-like protein 6 [Acipenser oxyrinchus oxyrinchus]